MIRDAATESQEYQELGEESNGNVALLWPNFFPL